MVGVSAKVKTDNDPMISKSTRMCIIGANGEDHLIYSSHLIQDNVWSLILCGCLGIARNRVGMDSRGQGICS